ncbi:hypothetical protein ADU59_00760 (plasmid) [Pararhizobium polonicum]|uniref:Uncharacterized protein n=2 Tax=Pararhizobium polonicum TaxID=1612624 RepID=A0A1C7P8H7_9HYPH|nr:hypothetical protein ADU59_00760 [Pararhizobium polonicum]
MQVRLRAAVQSIWLECGERPPTGTELDRAAASFAEALASGRRIARMTDKTLQPLCGRRSDLEDAKQSPQQK